jgi:hypothetical protein
MRVLLAATMAASALAIGLRMEPAQSLPLGGNSAGPDTAVQMAQQKEMTPAPGGQSPGQSPGMSSPGQGQGSQGTRGQGGPAMGGPATGGGKLRGEGPQFQPGARGTYGYGPRTGERGRVWIGREHDRGRMRRHFGYRDDGGPSYGFRSDCRWLRHRALETGSHYWWRRYRDCIH